MTLSINAWVFGGLSGIDYYRIDPAIGTEHSLMVCTMRNQLNGSQHWYMKLTDWWQCLIIASSLIQLPLSAVKISILLFYKRIFSTPKFKVAVWIMISLVSVWGAIFFVVGISVKSLQEEAKTP